MKHGFIKTLVVGLFAIGLVTGCTGEMIVTNIEHPDRVREFKYNDHQYIMFEDYGDVPRGDITGVVHDPDCPCHNK